MRIVCFVGPNGCGKGTQINRLVTAAENAGRRSKSISVSDELKQDPACIERMNAGQLVDDPLVIAVVDRVLESLNCDVALLDGFPRSFIQAERVIEMTRAGFDVLVLCFQVSEQTVKNRCGNRGRGRDDSPEVVERRLEVYRKETSRGVELMQEMIPEHLHVIDGEGGEDAVFAAILKHVAF